MRRPSRSQRKKKLNEGYVSFLKQDNVRNNYNNYKLHTGLLTGYSDFQKICDPVIFSDVSGS